MMAYWMGFLGLLVGLAWYYAAQGARDARAPRAAVRNNNGVSSPAGSSFAGSTASYASRAHSTDTRLDINPATGLLMLDGLVDVGGNLYGTDDHSERLSALDDSGSLWDAFDSSPGINPASGLPMLDSAIDVGGNPYGSDAVTSTFSSFDDDFSASSSISSFSDDSFMSSSSSWDDSSWM